MEKMATVSSVLKQSADVMEKLAHERDLYKERYLKLAMESDVSEVLTLMQERDLNPDVTTDDLRERLTKQAGEGRLEITKQAVLMSGPGGGIVSLGSADDMAGSATASDASKAQLNALLLGNED